MSVLIVGADYIRSIENLLNERGFDAVTHWTARTNSACHRKVPSHTELIVVLTDFLNHGMARHVKKVADTRGLPIIYSKRSIPELDVALKSYGERYA